MEKNQVICVLDRDGTINYDPGWFGRDPNWAEHLKLLPGVMEGIKKLNSIGRVIVASNQYGVARGYFSLETVLAINQALDKLLRAQGAFIENWQVCPYVDYDWAAGQGLNLSTPWVVKGDTALRKPNIGMIQKAAEELGLDYKRCRIYSIGNRRVDVETGLQAGGRGIIIHDQAYEKEYEQMKELAAQDKKCFCAENFLMAVDWIAQDLQKTQ